MLERSRTVRVSLVVAHWSVPETCMLTVAGMLDGWRYGHQVQQTVTYPARQPMVAVVLPIVAINAAALIAGARWVAVLRVVDGICGVSMIVRIVAVSAICVDDVTDGGVSVRMVDGPGGNIL